MSDFSSTKIAIVGAGPAGMTALKEFLSLGYDVTVFEKKDDVGGVWNWSEDTDATTALKETKLCNNKYSVTLGDYPVSKDFPWVVSAPILGQYLRDYAHHYTLYPHIEFSKTITSLTRDPDLSKWHLHLADESHPRSFDKIVWATGCFVRPKTLTLPNQDVFQGSIEHSSRARNIASFKGKNVIVLGIGNTAADTTTALVQHGAGKIYFSHRRGAKIISPTDVKTGIPTDVMLSTGLLPVTWFMQKYCLGLYSWVMDQALVKNFTDAWGSPCAAWGLEGPSLQYGQHVIVCSTELVPSIKSGRVLSVPGIKRIAGPRSVEFDDGQVAEDIDAIIMCIGYDDDLSLLDAAVEFAPAEKGAPRLPNLYMNMFPPKYHDSFAYLSLTHLLGPQIPGRELVGLALPQIWAGRSRLPGVGVMNEWIAKHQAWVRGRIANATPNGNGYQEVDNGDWSYFMHEAAGTGLYEYIGWGRKAWALWLKDRELYRAVSNLPISTYTYRLFDMGKRKPYKGAREAVIGAYRDLVEFQKLEGKKTK